MQPKYKRPIRPILFVVGPSICYVQLSQGLFSLIDLEAAISASQTSQKTV